MFLCVCDDPSSFARPWIFLCTGVMHVTSSAPYLTIKQVCLVLQLNLLHYEGGRTVSQPACPSDGMSLPCCHNTLMAGRDTPLLPSCSHLTETSEGLGRQGNGSESSMPSRSPLPSVVDCFVVGMGIKYDSQTWGINSGWCCAGLSEPLGFRKNGDRLPNMINDLDINLQTLSRIDIGRQHGYSISWWYSCKQKCYL